MDFLKKRKWSLLATILLAIVVLLNYEQYMPVSSPPSFKLNGFPFLEQPDQITCGPTSAAMVLQYYGKDVSIQQAKKVTKTQWFSYNEQVVGMTSPDFIQHVFKHFGVPARIHVTDFGHLKYYVSQNRPPVALVRSGLKTWHYVVVIGYDEENIILADPGWGKTRIVSMEIFEKAWNFTSDLRGTDFGNLDYWKLAIETTDVRRNTLIVPKDVPNH